MSGKVKIGKVFYFNCLLALIWLWFRGKIKKIIILKWIGWTPHFTGILFPSGNYIHFKTNETYDTYRPFLFCFLFAG